MELSIEELMRPFDASQVRQRTGPGRKPLDYISGPDVIRRLLDATGNQFAWNVERVQLVTQETANGPVSMWLVQGTLTVGDLGGRSGVGTHPADSVEAAKAAETDALKRAAIKFGVGLHLYEEDHGSANGSSPAPAPTGARSNGNGRQSAPPAAARTGNANGNGGYAGARRAAPTYSNGVGENAPF